MIGSDHVAGLIQSLDEVSRAKIGRCPCNITFKFGNQGTLTSQHALVVPVGEMLLKIAVVPGGTPFLVSNTFMRAIRASIDCFSQTLASPIFQNTVQLELTSKGLFLVNLNDIIQAAAATSGEVIRSTKLAQETFVMTPVKNDEKTSAGNDDSPTGHARHEPVVSKLTSIEANLNSVNEDVRDKRVQKPVDAPVQAQNPQTVQDPSIPTSTLSHGFVGSSEEPSGTSQGPTDGLVRFDIGTDVPREDHLWSESSGPHIRNCLGGSTMDQFHGVEVQQQHSPLPSQADEVHRTQGGEARARPDADSSTPCKGVHGQRVCLDKRPFWKQIHPAYGQEQGLDSHTSGSTNSTGWRRGAGVRDVQWGDYGLTIASGRDRASERESGVPSCAGPSAADGKCLGQGHSSLGKPSRTTEVRLDQLDLSAEVTADSCVTTHHDVGDLRKLIHQFSTELEQIEQSTRSLGKPFVLGEVFCSENSPLTQQVQNLDQQAFRHGLQQGDLSTASGRSVLFEKICRHNPMNIWYSPICGPWSSWSALNASRSTEHQMRYQELRHSNRYQIALGIVLYRHQVGKGRHFHWEQPAKSLMMIHPGMNEVHQHSQTCQFDMCTAGQLTDPVNGLAMKKGMQLLTTNAIVFENLHGMTCRREHQHQPIEGSTKVDGQWKLRTEYTEIYPRKFARMVAKLLCKHEYVRPFNWKYSMSLNATNVDPILAGKTSVLRPTKTRGRSNFVRSQLMTPEPLNDPAHKRRRLEGKCAPPVPMEMCQEIFRLAQDAVPRVGKIELGPELVYQLQLLFHEKEIVSAIACRGTDRTMAPPNHLVPEAAPYRRTLMIMRPSGEIKYEKEWERWDVLSRRQLVRPAHPCRINITVFARDRTDRGWRVENSGDTTSSDRQPSAEPQSQQSSSSTVPAPQDGETRPSDTTIPETDHLTQPANTPESEPMEIRRQDQGDSFKSLPKWEQNQLLQMHRNLGHPSNERFAKALQENGQRPEMVRAAQELKCSVCAAQSAPKHRRPAHLKPVLDFNYRIYLDGIKWTNKDGESFQFYHIVDAGTLFHVAFVAPAHTSQDVINLLHQHWMGRGSSRA